MAPKKPVIRKHRGPGRPKLKKRLSETHRCGRITANAFLNFVRDVRKNQRGLSVCEIGSKAGKMWRSMTEEQKRPYYLLAKKAKLQERHYRKGLRKEKKRRRNDCRLKRRSASV